MTAFRDDLESRIAALEQGGAAREWTVETIDGRVLCTCHSHEDAINQRALIVRLSRDDILALKVSHKTVTPEYVSRTGLKSADSRFCDWALMQLGRVLILTSKGVGGSRFVVSTEEGQCGTGRTLAAALFGLVHFYLPAAARTEKGGGK
ncbi:hypothetical protein [Paraburkholderia sp. C35]|uniref:hypothetical protein n=1 Tax=Paraburkholderia sp. C35 TaxID=2126993 RepID=UPI0013A53E95|nr:hypothetical protein [Paraburkholderia sp. C35]